MFAFLFLVKNFVFFIYKGTNRLTPNYRSIGYSVFIYRLTCCEIAQINIKLILLRSVVSEEYEPSELVLIRLTVLWIMKINIFCNNKQYKIVITG